MSNRVTTVGTVPTVWTLAHLIDVLTASASLGVKFIGFPQQVRANRAARREGRKPGLVWEVCLAFMVSYLLWVLHGIVNHDWVEVTSQGMGAVISGYMLYQAIVKLPPQ